MDLGLDALAGLIGFAITMLLVLLVVSVLASTLVEVWSGLLSSRSAMLRAWLAQTFDDPAETGFAHKLFNSALVRSLAREGKFPDYIASETLAQAVVAVVRESGIVDHRQLPPVLRGIALSEGFGTDAERRAFGEKVRAWYDRATERLSGAYRQRARGKLFVAGFLLAVGFNIDLVAITGALWTQRETLGPLTEEIVAFERQVRERAEEDNIAVEAVLETHPEIREALAAILRENEALAGATLPVGWALDEIDCTAREASVAEGAASEAAEDGCTALGLAGHALSRLLAPASWPLSALVGWVLTALAVLPGASFWFDVLGRALALRAIGRNPLEEDRKNLKKT